MTAPRAWSGISIPECLKDSDAPHVGTFTGPTGTYQQTTTPSPEAEAAFQALDLPLPPRVLHLDTTASPIQDTSPAA